MSIESPKYDLIKHNGKFELRHYRGFITANVTVTADNYASAGSMAFNTLADYIFGNNTSRGNIDMTAPVNAERVKSEKIAMTAPVDATKLNAGKYRVSFTMPSAYSMRNLPKPNNSAVEIKETKNATFAAIKFSGYTGDDRVSKMAQMLQDWCNSNNIKITGEPVLSRFDAPIKPGFLRHNEILYRVKA
jgi:hypothetical protein